MAIKIILDANVKGLYKKEDSNGDRNLLHNIFQILKSIYRDQKIIQKQNQKIMDTQTQIVEKINAAIAQLGKIKEESTATLTKVSELQAVIDNQGGVSPELQEAVDKLLAQAKVVDDLVPDAIPPVEPPVEPGL